MKRLILFELIILFLATTFESDSPPGWFQQTLPVNDQVNDIFFLDSLTGWVCTAGASSGTDTGYVMKTMDGGNNWSIQYSQIMNLNVIQFINNNTGYTGGGNGLAKLFKTTNSGAIWTLHSSLGFITIKDLFFVNVDTGWICDDNPINGGIFITTNGGSNWQSQLGAGFSIKKLFFISKDTGWAGSNEANGKLYRTTNGGLVWNLQYTINAPFESIYFINGNNGWIRAGTSNSVQYTTNGGSNWTNAQGNIITGFDIKFMNDSIGYSGTFTSFRICKSTDGGKTWGFQNTPLISGNLVATLLNDTSNAWASQIMHTTDGGGPIMFTGIHQIGTEVPEDYKLFQNYPNPFNPKTIIRFQITRSSDVKIVIYNIQGKEITTLVNKEQKPGTYEVDFNGSNYSSGIYFYSLIIDGKVLDTKKMILIK